MRTGTAGENAICSEDSVVSLLKGKTVGEYSKVHFYVKFSLKLVRGVRCSVFRLLQITKVRKEFSLVAVTAVIFSLGYFTLDSCSYT